MVAALVVVVTAVAWWRTSNQGLPQVGPPRPANLPSAGREEAAHPLGTPPPVARPAGGSSYRSTAVQADGKTPVAYDPCRPVHYVVRLAGAPPGGQVLISEAIARVSHATGLQFRYDGPTREAPSRQREPFQRSRYGDRWAPVLIAWVTPQENPDFATDVAGEAGSVRIALTGQPAIYVSGQVELDATKLATMLTQPQGQALARAVIEHELGHLVGLAHVTDPTQLMYPKTRPGIVDYGAGDQAGLAALGQGACVPAL